MLVHCLGDIQELLDACDQQYKFFIKVRKVENRMLAGFSQFEGTA